ncbi:MAG: HlyD family efflux transporter periplasmic adaptor subunit [Chitinophagaceae bacterium]|jgi:multidrug resistance efflux pump|nr:HlyD family efflux transporter periplasmic adaptor subunit [Chitinophagaceae bacterium]MCA6469119.1 HlyD family efflux transporter periplasmic adaptor subunit [Chitinophagaceae bacterium]MCA6476745.1 HlyD family efflux transporter periplasmic adaptor subunit [Chitinophagaceae bacterium]MCA6480236.1 HlyD family efflux transporter periplasmic adaptor subunit [Chitinophagaceae bacterium]MCA6491758.1 HlyD family efflux transporter periplasmic adaptor subunit [Chitinophagaceae bacterium]
MFDYDLKETHFLKPKQSNSIYLLSLFLVLLSVSILPIIKTNISVKSTGLTRPHHERTELKPVLSGIIATLLVKEGDTILQGQLIATIKDNNTEPRFILNEFELTQRLGFISDLEKLTSNINYESLVLQTPLYRQQLSKFLFQLNDQLAAIKKVNREREINNQLIKDKVIAPKEHFDKEIEAERLQASFNAFKNEQITNWQNDLQRYKLEISQFTAQRNQIETDKKNHFIYAPVSGIIQNINTRYAGGFISAGETLCIISPQSNLIGECYVSTRDVGLLKLHQPVRFQIDAFDYNYFGILTGKVIAIDNDFTMAENKLVFKVRCSFDSTQLLLKNGYKGELKKGLTFQARFVVAERTLWQLLFDKVDDWLNPTAPPAHRTAKQP